MIRCTPLIVRHTYDLNKIQNVQGGKKSTLRFHARVLGYWNWVLGKFITDKEDPDHPASTHLPSTRGLLMRIGTQGTIQKIREDHGMLPKA
jgi:hypothetical protein